MNDDATPGHAPSGIAVVLEDCSCPMGCANAQDFFVLSGRDRLHRLPGEFKVVRCSVCGLMRTNPRPTPETIGYYYPPGYSPHQQRSTDTSLSFRDRIAARVHTLMNAWRIPKISPGRLLEFGCGSGSYLRWMARQGWDVAGVEASPVAAETVRALGFPVHAGTVETLPPVSIPYDLNVGWMALEHLHRPIEALQRLASGTRDNGWLAVSVPNAASREFKWFGDSWYALELPRHLYHFTPQTITELLGKGGWRVQEILHQRSVDNFVASCGYQLERSGARWAGLAKQLIDFPTNVPLHFLTYPLLFPVATVLAAFGETGRMTIWAQKLASGPANLR